MHTKFCSVGFLAEKKNVSHADTHHPQCPSGLVGLPGVSDSLRWRGEDVVHNGTAAGHWGQLDGSDGHNAAIVITHLCPHDLHWCTKVRQQSFHLMDCIYDMWTLSASGDLYNQNACVFVDILLYTVISAESLVH